MSKISELDAKIAALQKEREAELNATRAAALADVKAKIAEYKITPTELKGVLKAKRKRKAKVVTNGAVAATPVNAPKAAPKAAAKKAAAGQGPKKA